MDRYEMSDEHKAMVEAIGTNVVEKLLQAAKDPQTTSRVLDNITSQVQQAVGRAVLRVLIYLAVGCFSFLALSDKVGHAVKEIFK